MPRRQRFKVVDVSKVANPSKVSMGRKGIFVKHGRGGLKGFIADLFFFDKKGKGNESYYGNKPLKFRRKK